MKVDFMVTGQGRSGTLWLARLLNEGVESTTVFHEPCEQSDAGVYWKLYFGNAVPGRYFQKRTKRMGELAARNPDKGFAEVNSYLRYCAREYERFFHCPIAAIIRDGRYVVRSMLKRDVYRSEDRPRISPVRDSQVASMWDDLSPLAKSSWYWADTYQRLSDLQVPIFRVEDLTERFSYVQSLGKHLGVKIDRDVYEKKFQGQRRHVSIDPKEPLRWSVEETAQFLEFASDVQSKFNYPTE